MERSAVEKAARDTQRKQRRLELEACLQLALADNATNDRNAFGVHYFHHRMIFLDLALLLRMEEAGGERVGVARALDWRRRVL